MGGFGSFMGAIPGMLGMGGASASPFDSGISTDPFSSQNAPFQDFGGGAGNFFTDFYGADGGTEAVQAAMGGDASQYGGPFQSATGDVSQAGGQQGQGPGSPSWLNAYNQAQPGDVQPAQQAQPQTQPAPIGSAQPNPQAGPVGWTQQTGLTPGPGPSTSGQPTDALSQIMNRGFQPFSLQALSQANTAGGGIPANIPTATQNAGLYSSMMNQAAPGVTFPPQQSDMPTYQPQTGAFQDPNIQPISAQENTADDGTGSRSIQPANQPLDITTPAQKQSMGQPVDTTTADTTAAATTADTTGQTPIPPFVQQLFRSLGLPTQLPQIMQQFARMIQSGQIPPQMAGQFMQWLQQAAGQQGMQGSQFPQNQPWTPGFGPGTPGGYGIYGQNPPPGETGQQGGQQLAQAPANTGPGAGGPLGNVPWTPGYNPQTGTWDNRGTQPGRAPTTPDPYEDAHPGDKPAPDTETAPDDTEGPQKLPNAPPGQVRGQPIPRAPDSPIRGQPLPLYIPPDQRRRRQLARATPQEGTGRGGGGVRVGTAQASLPPRSYAEQAGLQFGRPSQDSVDRSQYQNDMNNPQLVYRMAQMVAGEVGEDAPNEVKQGQLETAYNRVAYGLAPNINAALSQVARGNPYGYYPASTFANRPTARQIADFKQNVLGPVLAGSNNSDRGFGPATGNASGGLAMRQMQKMPGFYVQTPSGPEGWFREKVGIGQGLPTAKQRPSPKTAPERSNIVTASAAGPADAGTSRLGRGDYPMDMQLEDIGKRQEQEGDDIVRKLREEDDKDPHKPVEPPPTRIYRFPHPDWPNNLRYTA